VPPKDDKAFAKFLEALGYPYAEETGNPAYRMFLRA
jgi:threonine dehydratase